MKNVFVNIIVLLLKFNLLIAQCPEGDVLIVKCQEDLSNFALNYPNCTELNNISIEIPLNEDCENRLINFRGLENIRTINGDINLTFGGYLQSFEGLNNVEEIKGIIYSFIPGAQLLKNFIGLEKLKKFGGIDCHYCGGFTSFKGLINLEEITGSLYFDPFSRIIDVAALPNLKRINLSLAIPDAAFDKESFKNLEYVGGKIDLFRLRVIDEEKQETILTDTLNMFNKLKTAGSVEITFTVNYKVVSGFKNLENLDRLYITRSGIKSILGFSKVKSLETLIIASNKSIYDISGLHNLEVSNNIEITGNPQLTECSIESICSYLPNNEEYLIEDNKEGCNSAFEILNKCSRAKPETGSFGCN